MKRYRDKQVATAAAGPGGKAPVNKRKCTSDTQGDDDETPKRKKPTTAGPGGKESKIVDPDSNGEFYRRRAMFLGRLKLVMAYFEEQATHAASLPLKVFLSPRSHYAVIDRCIEGAILKMYEENNSIEDIIDDDFPDLYDETKEFTVEDVHRIGPKVIDRLTNCKHFDCIREYAIKQGT